MRKKPEFHYEIEIEGALKQVLVMPFIQQALALLASYPEQYCYHNLQHTHDVMHEAALFALYDELPQDKIELLLIAAAFHDIAVHDGINEHEANGARVAEETLRSKSSLAEEDIQLISQMIRDTKLVQSPKGGGIEQVANTNLSKYLCDADLSNLGRDDFFEKLELVERESGASHEEFMVGTLGLVTRHSWHTRAARELRMAKEVQNVLKLVQLIRQNKDSKESS